MRLLYVTAVWSGNKEPNMHSDFVEAAAERGHDMTVLALCEKRTGISTHCFEEHSIKYLLIKCGNIQKTNKYQKVISSICANYVICRAAHKYLKAQRFDAIVWSVSSTLMYFSVKRLKKHLHACLYLLLKEYWPQDPIDLGAISADGCVAGCLRFVERQMLKSADIIGVSSQGGIRYVERLYPQFVNKCEVCPHCEKSRDVNHEKRAELLESLGVPSKKTVFIYGGNFGVSQGIDDMISCISEAVKIDGTFFLMLGAGTEYEKAKNALAIFENVKFLKGMSYSDFLSLAAVCDCGMIFLYKNYTVPNIPGKLNTYLNAEIPIIACVDRTTDAGSIIQEAGAGISVLSGQTEDFCEAVRKMMNPTIRCDMGRKAKELLNNSYSAPYVVEIVEKAIGRIKSE